MRVPYQTILTYYDSVLLKYSIQAEFSPQISAHYFGSSS